MAHELENAKSMIYVGETPWHGLGVKLDAAPASTEEAIRMAGLDWEIELQQLLTPAGRQVERNAVIRKSDNSILGTVGMGWEPVQNRQAFAAFDPFLERGLATIETAGSLRAGRRVWMLAKVARPDSVIVPQADDRVAKYLLVAIGHDGTLAFHLGYTPTRVVCQNTLSVALHTGENTHVRIPHFSGANKAIEAVNAAIETIDARFERAADLFRALASVKVRNGEQLKEYIKSVFHVEKKALDPSGAELLGDLLAKPHVSTLPSPFSAEGGDMLKETKSRVMEEVAALFEGGKGNDAPGVEGTAWAAYNGVTQYMTWDRCKSQDARLEKIWLQDTTGVAARALPAAAATFLSN